MERVLELLQAILTSQHLMAWALVFIASLTFLAIVMTYWTYREIRENQKRMKEDSDRMNFYLYGKLGPLETK